MCSNVLYVCLICLQSLASNIATLPEVKTEQVCKNTNSATETVLNCGISQVIAINERGSVLTSRCDHTLACCAQAMYSIPVAYLTYVPAAATHWTQLLLDCNGKRSCRVQVIDIEVESVHKDCFSTPFCEKILYSCVGKGRLYNNYISML